MDSVNEEAVNSIMTTGPPKDLPNDGTGLLPQAIRPQMFTSNNHPGVVQLDPWLAPFKEPLRHRYSKAQQWIKTINENEGGLEKFSRVSRMIPSRPTSADSSKGNGEVRIQRGQTKQHNLQGMGSECYSSISHW